MCSSSGITISLVIIVSGRASLHKKSPLAVSKAKTFGSGPEVLKTMILLPEGLSFTAQVCCQISLSAKDPMEGSVTVRMEMISLGASLLTIKVCPFSGS